MMGDVPTRIVVDTNVLVSALISKNPATSSSRQLLRACAVGTFQPLISLSLFKEYEDVLSRSDLVNYERQAIAEQVLDGFVSLCEEIRIFFNFRPNLPDEADNHVLELAIAGSATYLVTHNLKDFRGELKLNSPKILTPRTLLNL